MITVVALALAFVAIAVSIMALTRTTNLRALSDQQFNAFVDLYQQHVEHEAATLMIATEIGRVKTRLDFAEQQIGNALTYADELDAAIRRLAVATTADISAIEPPRPTPTLSAALAIKDADAIEAALEDMEPTGPAN